MTQWLVDVHSLEALCRRPLLPWRCGWGARSRFCRNKPAPVGRTTYRRLKPTTAVPRLPPMTIRASRDLIDGQRKTCASS